MVFMPEIVTVPILILSPPYFHSWSFTLDFIFWFGLSFLTTKQGVLWRKQVLWTH